MGPRNRAGNVVDRIARRARPLVRSRPRLRARLARIRWALPRARPETPLEQVIFEFARAYPDAFFVQVGANDGVYRDPLRDEIRARRWRGIMVEPLPSSFERLRANYGGNSRIVLENAAIADEDGHRELYYLRETSSEVRSMPVWYDKLGTLHRDVIVKHRPAIPDFDQRLTTAEVPCLTFESLCRKHGVRTVDLVQVDTEGHDFEIVKLIDLDALRPKLLMYEHLHFDDATRTACSEHLRRHGYEEISDVVNTICLRTSSLTDRDQALHHLWLTIQGHAGPQRFHSDSSTPSHSASSLL